MNRYLLKVNIVRIMLKSNTKVQKQLMTGICSIYNADISWSPALWLELASHLSGDRLTTCCVLETAYNLLKQYHHGDHDMENVLAIFFPKLDVCFFLTMKYRIDTSIYIAIEPTVIESLILMIKIFNLLSVQTTLDVNIDQYMEDFAKLLTNDIPCTDVSNLTSKSLF